MRFEEIKRPLDWLYELSKKQNTGSIPSFVVGQIVTKYVLDQIKRDLPDSLSASWGQIMSSGGSLSPEADIVIFKGRPLFEWASVGFAVVPKENVVSVIECKQNIPSQYSDHEEYATSMKPF